MFSNKLYSNSNSRTYRNAPLALALSAALTFGTTGVLAAQPQRALAEDIDTNVQADAAQQEVERTAAEYERAIARIDELSQQIADNEQRIEELEESLPEQQQRSSAACVKLYKAQASTPGLIEMVLSSQNVVDFFTSLEYISHVFSSNQAEINRLGDLKQELEQTRQELESTLKEADTEADNAAQALSAAQEARQEAQRKAQEEAARQAEEAAKAAAQAQAEAEAKAAQEAQAQAEAETETQAQDSSKTEATSESESSNSGEVPTPTPDNADWSSDKATFVSEWAGRIDSYLAGSPMAGTGEIFAEAAWITAWTRATPPPFRIRKARRACTVSTATTPGVGVQSRGIAGKTPSATTWPAWRAATATPFQWRRRKNTARRTGNIGTAQPWRKWKPSKAKGRLASAGLPFCGAGYLALINLRQREQTERKRNHRDATLQPEAEVEADNVDAEFVLRGQGHRRNE